MASAIIALLLPASATADPGLGPHNRRRISYGSTLSSRVHIGESRRLGCETSRADVAGHGAVSVPQPGLLDVREMIVCPFGQRHQQFGCRPPKRGQRVLDADGNL